MADTLIFKWPAKCSKIKINLPRRYQISNLRFKLKSVSEIKLFATLSLFLNGVHVEIYVKPSFIKDQMEQT